MLLFKLKIDYILEAKSNFTLMLYTLFFGYKFVIFIKCLICIEVRSITHLVGEML